jgi:hypothetical protein
LWEHRGAPPPGHAAGSCDGSQSVESAEDELLVGEEEPPHANNITGTEKASAKRAPKSVDMANLF